MRNYQYEFDARVDFIRSLLSKSGAAGIVYGNSGGKDSALVGILCKAACENTLGLIMPCGSSRNYGQDLEDGQTDEQGLGITYRDLDAYLSGEAVSSTAKQKIRQMHEKSEHKRKGIILYPVETPIL